MKQHIRLSAEQLKLATRVGELRTIAGKGRKDLLKCDKSKAGEFDILAAIGECAAALTTGLPWFAYRKDHKNRFEQKVADVGPLEIKSIRNRNHKLIIHASENLGAPHLQTLVHPPAVTMLGWCFGFECFGVSKYFDQTLPTPAFARRSLYGLKSLENFLKSYGYCPREVRYPIFAKGYSP